MTTNKKDYYFIVWEEGWQRSGGWITLRINNNISGMHPVDFIIEAQKAMKNHRGTVRLRWYKELNVSPNKITSWQEKLNEV